MTDLASITAGLERFESYDDAMAFARRLPRAQRVLFEQAWADKAHTLPSAPAPVASYFDRPAAFARDMIRWPEGRQLVSYQAEAMTDLLVNKRESVRGPHGLGKTGMAALLVLWFALTRDEAAQRGQIADWKIATTAGSWDQLIHYLWPEVHKWAKLLRWEAMGRAPFTSRELLARNLKLDHGEAFGASPKEAGLIEGAHAAQILYVFDEAKSIPDDIWDAAEGAFSGAGSDTGDVAYAFAISTPGTPNGRFHAIQARRPGTEDWHARHVTRDEVIEAGRMSREWANDRARQWGEGSARYQRRVLGEFASDDEDGVIPLSWVEAAQQRWLDRWGEGFDPDTPLEWVGVDCSGSGADRTVLARVHGSSVAPLERPRKAQGTEAGDEEMATAGRLIGILEANERAKAVVDVVGLGAGVLGRVREKVARNRVLPFIAGAKTARRDKTGEVKFSDQRAAAWWSMRELLDPDDGSEVELPPDDELLGDLVAPHWKETSTGIRVESKDDMRSRLGRSTDAADAVIQAFWQPLPSSVATAPSSARLPTARSTVPGQSNGGMIGRNRGRRT